MSVASGRDVLVIAALLFMTAVAFLGTHYMANEALDSMINNTQINTSSDAVSSLQTTKNLTNRFDYLFFGLFIGLVLTVIISGWLVGTNPLFMFLYGIFIIIAVVVSAVFSNGWATFTEYNAFIVTATTNFPITNHILTYLPLYITAIGVLGMVVMFAKPFISND